MNSRRSVLPPDAITLAGIGSIFWDLTSIDIINSPVPGRVDEYNRQSLTYILVKGGHATVIQGPMRHYKSSIEDEEARKQESFQKTDEEMLSLETLLDTIHLEETDWAYMHYEKSLQKYRLIPDKPPMINAGDDSVPLWLPCAEEKDIELIRFLDNEVVEAVWNNMVVEAYIGWEENIYGRIVKMTRTFFHARHLDFTFKPLAHIIRDGSRIVGIIVERTKGRMIEFRDRSLVFETFAIMQANEIVLLLEAMNSRPGFVNQMFVVCDGKLKVLSYFLDLFRYIPSDVLSTLVPEGKLFNERELFILFDQLKIRPKDVPMSLQSPRKLPIISYRPSPERSFSDYSKSLEMWWLNKFVDLDRINRLLDIGWMAFEFKTETHEDISVDGKQVQRIKKRRAINSGDNVHVPSSHSVKRSRTKFLLVANADASLAFSKKKPSESVGFIEEVVDDDEAELGRIGKKDQKGKKAAI